MSMSKSNSKGKCLGPLFLNRGDGGLKTFEVEIQSGSYLNSGGWARRSQANTTSRRMHSVHTSVSCLTKSICFSSYKYQNNKSNYIVQVA